MCRFILLKEGDTCFPVPVEEIARFEGMSSYTNVYMTNGTVYRQCGHIGFWEETVKEAGLFVRIGKSHLVHYLQIVSFSKTGGVLLKDKSRLSLSANGFINLMGKFGISK